MEQAMEVLHKLRDYFKIHISTGKHYSSSSKSNFEILTVFED